MLVQTKTLKVLSGGTTSYRYEAFSRIIMVVKGETIPYRGKGTLYKLHPELRSALEAFIRQEKLRLSRKNYAHHARLFDYYNQLQDSSR